MIQSLLHLEPTNKKKKKIKSKPEFRIQKIEPMKKSKAIV
jgi:hypothetical protein